MHLNKIPNEKYTNFIIKGIILIFLLCCIFSLSNCITTYNLEIKSNNEIFMPFTNEGLKAIYKNYSLSFDIFKFCATIIILFTTISAMIIALKNYISVTEVNASIIESNTQNSELNSITAKINFFNHKQTHKQFFFDFINQSIDKNKIIHQSSIDKFILYHTIFEEKDDSSIQISENFSQLLTDLNHLIELSNAEFTHKKQNFFSNKNYQDKIIIILNPYGINLPKCFRREFFDLETDVLILIEEIAEVFGNKHKFPTRKYI